MFGIRAWTEVEVPARLHSPLLPSKFQLPKEGKHTSFDVMAVRRSSSHPTTPLSLPPPHPPPSLLSSQFADFHVSALWRTRKGRDIRKSKNPTQTKPNKPNQNKTKKPKTSHPRKKFLNLDGKKRLQCLPRYSSYIAPRSSVSSY